MELEKMWEMYRYEFEELDKEVFDNFCRNGEFVDGPIIAKPSDFDGEYGPYSPERWAFGQLEGDRLVCTKVQP